MNGIKTLTATLTSIGVLALPAAAFAEDTSGIDGYTNPGTQVETIVPPAPAPPPAVAPAPPAPEPVVEAEVAPAQEEAAPPEPDVSETAAQSPAQATVETTSGTLPFTGAELGILGAIGAALLLLGFTLRRLTTRSSEL